MRPRDESRIADDRDPAERHARRSQIVDRLQDRLVHQPHHCAELRRQLPLRGVAQSRRWLRPDQRRRNRDRMRDAACIGQQFLRACVARRRAGTRSRCSAGGRAADRCPGRPPDSRGTARRAAGRTSWCRTCSRCGARATAPARGSATATRHSRHRAASRSGRNCCRTVERMPSAPISRSACTPPSRELRRHAARRSCVNSLNALAAMIVRRRKARRAACDKARSHAVGDLRTIDPDDDAALGIDDLAGGHLDAEIGRCRAPALRSASISVGLRRCRRRGPDSSLSTRS